MAIAEGRRFWGFGGTVSRVDSHAANPLQPQILYEDQSTLIFFRGDPKKDVLSHVVFEGTTANGTPIYGSTYKSPVELIREGVIVVATTPIPITRRIKDIVGALING